MKFVPQNSDREIILLSFGVENNEVMRQRKKPSNTLWLLWSKVNNDDYFYRQQHSKSFNICHKANKFGGRDMSIRKHLTL